MDHLEWEFIIRVDLCLPRMLPLLMLLAIIGFSQAQHCVSDSDCDYPLDCLFPVQGHPFCGKMQPSRKLFEARMPPFGCRSNDDCRADQFCFKPNPFRRGKCVPKKITRSLAIMEPCTSNADCKPEENCAALPPRSSNKFCIPRNRRLTSSSMFGCRSSEECPSHKFCYKLHPMAVYGECISRKIRKLSSSSSSKIDVVKCVLDSECTGSQVCVVTNLLPLQPGICAPSDHGPLCSADSECSSPQTCVSLGQNDMGICLSPSRRHAFSDNQCKYDAECPSGMTCKRDNQPPFSVGHCVASRRLLTGCTSDAQCTDRQICSFQLHICIDKSISSPSRRLAFPPLFCENDRQCPLNCRCDSTHTCEC